MRKFIKNNILIIIVILFYIIIGFSQIDWGIPNDNHPFSYHMDEWAQAHSLRTTFKNGTPHVWGGGNGTVFFYIISGLLLIPFVIINIVNPFIIKSPLLLLSEQHKLFEVLRFQSILYGALSIVLVSYIAKKFLKSNAILAAFFYTITPIFLFLTIFYRYDTPVIFWLLLSLVFSFRYLEKPSVKNFLFSAIISSLTVTIKVSAIPLFFTLIASFFLTTPDWKKQYKLLVTGILVFIGVFIVAGIPDAIISYKEFAHWVYISTISNSIHVTDNFIISMPYQIFFYLFDYPALFGHLYYFTFVGCLLIWLVFILNHILKKTVGIINKNELFLFISFCIFAISIIALKAGGSGNRMLVMSPFVSLISVVVIQKLISPMANKYKLILIVLFSSTTLLQTAESLASVTVKYYPDPRTSSSEWVKKNIPKGTAVAIENIPIFQDIPDIMLKDFYTKQYFPKYTSYYNYNVYDSKTKMFPDTVIFSGNEKSFQYLKISEKKTIYNTLQKQGYKKIISFSSNLSYYHLFNTYINYPFMGIIGSSHTITVFKKV